MMIFLVQILKMKVDGIINISQILGRNFILCWQTIGFVFQKYITIDKKHANSTRIHKNRAIHRCTATLN